MKSIIIAGKTVTGNSYKDLKAKIMAAGLTGKAFTQAMAAAGNAFPKNPGANAHGTQPRNRHDRRVDAKMEKNGLKRETMDVGGIKLDIYTGPQQAVVGAIGQLKNRRNTAVLATHTYGNKPEAVLIAFRGNIEEMKAGEIAKKAFDRFLGTNGYSAVTAIKAAKVNGVAWRIVIGEDLETPNVKRFVQGIERAMFRDGVVIGATGEISTNLLLANADGRRQIAAWPMHNPGLYGVLDGNDAGARFALVGSRGIAKIDADGTLSAVTFSAIVDGVVKAIAGAKATFTTPWTKLETLKIGQVNDVSFAFKGEKENTFKLFAIGHEKTAVVTLETKENAIVMKGTVDYHAVNDEKLGGTPMSLLPNGQVLSIDRNGSGRSIVIREAKELEGLGLKGFPGFPATTTTPAPTAQA